MPLADLHAPRFRRRHQGTINKASLELLRQAVPGVGHLDDKTLTKLLQRINRAAWENAVQHRDGVELPEQLGQVFIGSCENRKGDVIDYKRSAELGQTVTHHNLGCDGLVAKVFYRNHTTRYHFKNRELWGFKACRTFTRAVGFHYPRQWQLYVRVENNRKTKSIEFKKGQLIDKRLSIPEQIATYNEFEL